MAELLLKIGAGSNYEDGDILCAFNRRRIRQCHAEHICHPWKMGVTGDGWRPLDCLAEHLLKTCHQYRYERVSQTEVLRTDQWTGETEILSATPNAKGEAIDVVAYLARRRAARAPDGGPKKAVFGTAGKEVWYGGRIDVSHAKLDLVWAKIEERTPHREADHTKWPFSEIELRHMLTLPVDDFDDAEAAALVEPEYDLTDPENPVLVRKRRRRVRWRDLFPLEIPPTTGAEHVLDKKRVVDARDLAGGPFSRTELVVTKT